MTDPVERLEAWCAAHEAALKRIEGGYSGFRVGEIAPLRLINAYRKIIAEHQQHEEALRVRELPRDDRMLLRGQKYQAWLDIKRISDAINP